MFEKMMNFIKKLVWRNENKYFSKVRKNQVNITGLMLHYNMVGKYYTKAIFSPVSAIMMKLYEIYGTTELPIYGIITNIGTVDLSRDETVNVTIQTSQPGIFWGSHSTDLNGVMMPESKNYTELINQELKKLFHVEFLEVKIEEVSALQLMDF